MRISSFMVQALTGSTVRARVITQTPRVLWVEPPTVEPGLPNSMARSNRLHGTGSLSLECISATRRNMVTLSRTLWIPPVIQGMTRASVGRLAYSTTSKSTGTFSFALEVATSSLEKPLITMIREPALSQILTFQSPIHGHLR